jgi:hypothetical protein
VVPTPLKVRGSLKAALSFQNSRAAAGEIPVPVSEADCGLPTPLNATVTFPVRVPVTVGVNVTLIVHIPDAAIVVPQLLVCAKSPLATTLVMLTAVAILLVAVIVCTALVDPTP